MEKDEAENKEPEFREHPEVLCGGSEMDVVKLETGLG
jgi:hypothetical protein